MTDTRPRVATTDTRPRVAYILPDGKVVRIIFDHGERRPPRVSFTLAGGAIVWAVRA